MVPLWIYDHLVELRIASWTLNVTHSNKRSVFIAGVLTGRPNTEFTFGNKMQFPKNDLGLIAK